MEFHNQLIRRCLGQPGMWEILQELLLQSEVRRCQEYIKLSWCDKWTNRKADKQMGQALMAYVCSSVDEVQ